MEAEQLAKFLTQKIPSVHIDEIIIIIYKVTISTLNTT